VVVLDAHVGREKSEVVKPTSAVSAIRKTLSGRRRTARRRRASGLRRRSPRSGEQAGGEEGEQAARGVERSAPPAAMAEQRQQPRADEGNGEDEASSIILP
jgi:hypothetical protein